MTRLNARLGHAAARPAAAVVAFAAVILLLAATPLLALPVGAQVARRIAQNTIREHIESFGTWGGVLNPHIEAIEPVDLGADRLAFNVRVHPSGHVLVAADDEFNPVLLYSDTHAFDLANANDPDSFEGWIVPEVGRIYQALKSDAAHRPNGARPDGWAASHVSRAWNHLSAAEESFRPIRKGHPIAGRDFSSEPITSADPLPDSVTGVDSGAVVGPVLSTDWAQGSRFNDYTPAGTTCTHTLSGCVAIATAQIMKYWNWPAVGTGSHSYTWSGTTVSANFAHAYNWSSMPRTLSGATAAQIDAVARLISDVGVAVEMNYGCGGSGAYTNWIGTTVLPTYFNYKAATTSVNRSNHTPADFFVHIQGELDASPRRPILFSVRTLDGASGHALVIDGYQTGSADLVHLNLGWGSSYQGWYNINADWSAGGYQWSASSQTIYPGIEPSAPHFTLTLAKSGTGTGIVTSSPAGINCGSTCSAPVDQGVTALLTATATPGSHFVSWGGDCSASGAVTVTRDSSCTARFDIDNASMLAEAVDSLSLAFSVGGNGGWYYETTVTENGGDAAQSGPTSDGGASSLQTTVTGPATLTFWWRVSSEPGYDFLTSYIDGVAQAGRISGEAAWQKVTLTIPAGAHTVKWEYSKDSSMASGGDAGWVDNVVVTLPYSTLSVSKTGNGAGTVTSSVAGIDCGNDCSELYANGTSVTLSASAASGSLFLGWTGACSGRSACTVAVGADITATAVFQSSPLFRRYFAEGAVTDFFDCWFALLNTGSTTAHVTMKFLKDGSSSNVTYLVDVPAGTRRTVDARQVAGLYPAGGFSTIIESDAPVVADRTLSWDTSGYGAHSETAIESPAQSWYLAEGSTIQRSPTTGFELYYLIENPNDRAVNVQVTYLRPAPYAPISKFYSVDALRRRTIRVNGEDAELASTDVSGVVTSLDASLPIIVERALYLNTQGQTFGAGHAAAGVTATSTDWFLAEGATGPVFDLYVLLANPGSAAAELDISYLLPDGHSLLKHYVVAGNSRKTILVNDERIDGISLAQTSVSTRVHSTNGVGVIVERAMWWPSPSSSWYESHCSAASATTGTMWAVAEGEQGGARNMQTYVLVANTSAFPGKAHVTLLFEDGTSAASDVDIPANSRTTIWMGGSQATADAPFGGLTSGKRFGTVVESLPVNGQTAGIVVERATYWDAGGRWWAAGTNAGGTKIR